MKIFAAKNCNRLLIKCILYPSLLNAVFFLTAHFLDFTFIQCYYFGWLQLLCGILLALAMRKGSRETVLREPQNRKRYAVLACVPLLVLLYDLFFPSSDLMRLYSHFLTLVYHRIGYAKMNNYTDFINVILCLGSVFFYKFRWLEHMKNHFQECKADHS